MHLLTQTLDFPAANLALDEALLEACVAGGLGSVLRFWEVEAPMVVVGRASRIDDEVHSEECQRRGVPVYRRVSGGLSIVTGPGCLMYTVVESLPDGKSDIDAVHERVLGKMTTALVAADLPVERAGTSDMVLAEDGTKRKFSGNSLRLARSAYLYHGTLLYDFDLPLISTLLKHPPRSPDYRNQRDHDDFIANLPATAEQLTTAIANQWQAGEQLMDWPTERTQQLVDEKYSCEEWNFSR